MGRLRDLCALMFVNVVLGGVKSTVVQTDRGAISGTEYKTPNNRTVYAFLGVPYAKAPVDELRFAEPQPADKWEEVRVAKYFRSSCIQYTSYISQSQAVLGDEDCLFLNVFTPEVSETAKLDVVVYLHGGAFMFGGGDRFTPDFILEERDVVYVSVNYRLGPFGFLSTEDDVIPGNNGMKDQVMALEWVQKNIAQFGGDKDKVTLTGLSAGGASVHFHFLSPLSRDLFHRGISQSGTAFCPWALTENARSKAEALAKSVDCPTGDSKLMLECLRGKPAKSLLEQTDKLFMPWRYNPFSPFGPVVEKPSPRAFLDRSPHELVATGNVKDAPWLASLTTEEGLFPLALFITDENALKEMDQDWTKIAPHLLDFGNTVAHPKLNEVSEEIRKFYFGDGRINSENVKDLVRMVGDRLFAVEIERAARMQAAATKSPVYFYVFAYKGKYSYAKTMSKNDDLDLGTCHADDTLYLLKAKNWASPLETEKDKEMLNTMVRIWTNFISSGDPTPFPGLEWPTVSPDRGNLSYVLISSGSDIQAASSADLGNRAFWDSLPFAEPGVNAEKSKRYVDEL